MKIQGPEDLYGLIVKSETTGQYITFSRHESASEREFGTVAEWYGVNERGEAEAGTSRYNESWEDIAELIEQGIYVVTHNPRQREVDLEAVVERMATAVANLAIEVEHLRKQVQA